MIPPIQLKDQLFCRVLRGEKKPFEIGWQNNGYTYEEIQKFNDCENYGVIAGINNLALLDDDTPTKMLHKLWDENFPETFQIRGHYYFRINGWDCKKVVLWGSDGEHLGELQGLGSQGVCAGSLHPSGQYYKIIKDLPIQEIELSDFERVFAHHLRKKINQEAPQVVSRDWKGEDIKDIPITNIFPSNLKKCPSCGCSSGTNFKVYPESNSYFCYHSWTGGGIWEAIAISENIKSCSDIGRSCLSDSDKQAILKVAREKYGLKVPEPSKESMGWACSVNIKHLAERHNFTQCHLCNSPFEFDERMGWFSCPSCGLKGGLKMFAGLILKLKQLQKEATA
jgi:hypothetical protein